LVKRDKTECFTTALEAESQAHRHFYYRTFYNDEWWLDMYRKVQADEYGGCINIKNTFVTKRINKVAIFCFHKEVAHALLILFFILLLHLCYFVI